MTNFMLTIQLNDRAQVGATLPIEASRGLKPAAQGRRGIAHGDFVSQIHLGFA
jgi:hypothetical protein